jgi:hypothetical protein
MAGVGHEQRRISGQRDPKARERPLPEGRHRRTRLFRNDARDAVGENLAVTLSDCIRQIVFDKTFAGGSLFGNDARGSG